MNFRFSLQSRGLLAPRLCFALLIVSSAVLLPACGGGGGGADTSVQAPANIVAQPVDQTILAGSTATLSVTVSGSATYQWQREGINGWTAIDGAVNSTFTILAPTRSDDGARFRVLVRSSDTGVVITSSAVTLHVSVVTLAPTITVAPVSLVLVTGQVASLSVTAAGTSLTYQWERSADGVNFDGVPGATGATLVLESVSLKDTGSSFRVVVTNSVGSVTSLAALLTITAAPTAPMFLASPISVTAVVGSDVHFDVIVSGVPAPTIAWQSSPDGVNWTDMVGQVMPTLVVSSVSTGDDAKQIRAVASNSIGSVPSSAAALTVVATPVAAFISSPPVDTIVGLGGRATFHISGGGTPAPTYQWQVSADNGLSYANVNGATSPDLIISAAGAIDSGHKFRCIVQNASGSSISSAALLNVLPAPQIVQQPEPQAWRTGLPFPQFQVSAAGSGLSFQWQIRSDTSTDFSDVPGATSSTAMITPPATDATVRAVITNAAGGSTASDEVSLSRLRWTYLSPGPTGDTMRAVRWLDAITVLAVGDSGTIMHSIDGGQTWDVVREADSANAMQLVDLVVSSVTTAFALGEDGRILRTIDGGLHWLTVHAGTNGLALTSLAISDSQTLVAVGNNGSMIRSVDGGLTWAPVGLGTTDLFVRVSFRAGVGIAVTNEGHVYRSINGGAQWSLVFTSTLPLRNGDLTFVSDSKVLFVNAYGDRLSSADAGVTWYTSAPSLPGSAVIAFKDENVGVALPRGLGSAYTTNNGGLTWVVNHGWYDDSNHIAFDQAATAVAYGPGGVAVAFGTRGVIRRSTDGGLTWSEVDTAVFDQVIAKLDFGSPAVGVGIGAGSGSMLYQTSDGGVHWMSTGANVQPATYEYWINVAFIDSNTVLALDSVGNVSASTDGGATWSHRGNAPAPVTNLAFGQFGSPTRTATLANFGGLLARSVDGGFTWQTLANAPCARSFADPNDSTIVVLGCNGHLFRSVNTGATWIDVRSGFDSSTNLVRFSDATHGVASFAFGEVDYTADGGATWQTSSPAGGNLPTFSSIWFTSAREGFALGDGTAIYHTLDAGLTWSLDLQNRLPGYNAGTASLLAGAALDSHTSIVGGSYGAVMRRSN